METQTSTRRKVNKSLLQHHHFFTLITEFYGEMIFDEHGEAFVRYYPISVYLDLVKRVIPLENPFTYNEIEYILLRHLGVKLDEALNDWGDLTQPLKSSLVSSMVLKINKILNEEIIRNLINPKLVGSDIPVKIEKCQFGSLGVVIRVEHLSLIDADKNDLVWETVRIDEHEFDFFKKIFAHNRTKILDIVRNRDLNSLW